MHIESGATKHVEQWAQLRAALWPDQSVEAHRNDLTRLFLAKNHRAAAFVAQNSGGETIGFAEATLRHDFVNGCDSSPVLFLEGIYVRPIDRRKDVARLLCRAEEAWGKSTGCTEFGSDALLENAESHIFHASLGFEETERVVYFRKTL